MRVDGAVFIHHHRLGLDRLLFSAGVLSRGLQRDRHCVGPSHRHHCFYLIGLEVPLRALDKIAADGQRLRIKRR